MDRNLEREQRDEKVAQVENFFGVYLLLSQNPKCAGRTYVGFTVDPIRRLKQHNAGREGGGARRTSSRGPWAMVLLVYGFPNMISALRFEWAWQHPRRSRRLNHLPGKKAKEKVFAYHIRLLGEMLRMGPWNRLPLHVRWLTPDSRESVDFDKNCQPPIHMAVSAGPITAAKKRSKKPADVDDPPSDNDLLCGICIDAVRAEDRGQCISPKCQSVFHLVCLAQQSRQTASEGQQTTYFLPVDGACPVCDFRFLWGDVIRKRNGCFKDLPFRVQEAGLDDQH